MKILKSFTVLALPLALAACHSYLDVDRAAALATLPDTAAQFELEGRLAAQEPVSDWWNQLQDAALEQLLEQAFAHNQDLAMAQASLAESRALLRQAGAERFPTLDASVGGTRDKLPTAINPLRPGSIMQTYDATLDTSWEVDLFTGRLGNAVKAGRANLAEREAALRAAQVSVAAEVASAYVSLRGNQYLLDVAQRNAQVQRRTFELTQTLQQAGQGDLFDVSRAQGQLALTESRIPALEAAVHVALNRLGVLTGQGSEALRGLMNQVQPLPSLPASVAVGDPRALLQRRPDISQMEAALQLSAAQYNIAVADLYPRIVFNGSLGFLATDWSDLGRESSEVFSFAPSLQWGGLNQGRAQARIAAADARTQSQVAAFEKQVLLALEETDNALRRFTREEERRAKLQEAAQASAQAANFARQRFEVGASDFLSVLDAERSQLEVDAQLAESETQLLLNLVSVYKALGGGWEVAQQR
ncbi:MAG TPA: efflux transporter outer membrane subunit [Hyphomicrobiales bacterium]|nr:efflux transporter outer membrane subunit [Hyphomicrobiales bacterium]